MFFSTKDSLKKIVSRTLFNFEAIELPYFTHTLKEMQLIRSHKTIIVHISDISYFEEEDILAVELYDGLYGDCYCSAFIDKTKWDWIDQKYFVCKVQKTEKKCSHRFLTIGSVIIIKEYCFENIIINDKNIEERKDDEEYYLEDVLKIDNFFVIGHDENFLKLIN